VVAGNGHGKLPGLCGPLRSGRAVDLVCGAVRPHRWQGSGARPGALWPGLRGRRQR